MRALLHMIETQDDLRRAVAVCAAQQMTIVHRRCHQELDENIIRQGWFMRNGFWILGLGATFGDHWQITGSPDPQGKPFTGLCIHFAGTCWDMPREVQESLVRKGGGRVVDAQEEANVIVVTPRQQACLSAPAAAIIVPERCFPRVLSAARILVPEWPSNHEAASIWALISSNEWLSIQQGVSLAGALGGEIDALLEGVDVNEDGELFRGPHFPVTGYAEPFLNVALLGLLSVAPKGTRAASRRASVRKLAMKVAGIPILKGFELLEELQLTLSEDTNAKDLTTFGPLPALRRLSIARMDWCYISYFVGRPGASLGSLTGLEAPVLEHLSIRALDLRDVDALGRSPRLQSVNLERNSELKSIEGLAPAAPSLRGLVLDDCHEIESIAPLESATQLQRVHLKNCRSLVSLEPLSGCKTIVKLDLEGCGRLISLEGVGGLVLGGTEFSLSRCNSLTSLTGLPTLGPSITTLNLEGARSLRNLTGILSTRDITARTATVSSVMDVTPLSPLANLQEIRLASCSELRSLEGLPATLTRIGGERRKTIDLKGCGQIESLAPLAGTGVVTTATRIDLDGCFGLSTLAGLEALRALKTVYLPPTITDASALAHRRRSITIKVSLEGIETFPAGLARALAEVPKLELSLCSSDLQDCSSLAEITSLLELDLLKCPNVKDIAWVVGIPLLKRLRLAAASPAAQQAKDAYFDRTTEIRQMTQGRCTCAIYGLQQARYTTTKIRELQQAICARENLPLPPHLAGLPEGELVTEATNAGALSTKHPKTGRCPLPGFNDRREAKGMVA
jgi:hypothetical protein